MKNKNEYYSCIIEASGSIGTIKLTEKSRWYDPKPLHGSIIDKLYREIDGIYYFDTGNGMLAAHTMREIADKIDDLNKDWDENIAQPKPIEYRAGFDF